MRHAIAAVLLGLALPVAAVAQDGYPSKPVRVVVPFPSGPIDMQSRLYGATLAQQMGQPFVVENKAGATGTIGADVVAKAAPDGYTVLMTVDLPIVKAPHLLKISYDPLKDFVPVAIFGEDVNLVGVNPGAGLKTLDDLVAAAKAKPGAINFGSAGNGSPAHLCGELIKRNAGLDLTHVPYKGAGPALNAVLQGEVAIFCGPISALAPHVKAARLVALAHTGDAPAALLPEVKSLDDRWPGSVVSNWYGFLVPAKTPAPIVAALRRELRKAYDTPDVKARVVAAGVDVKWLEGAAATARIEGDYAKWGKLIREAKITAD
ncbi:MAG: Bug family tripartite tricarboxylate transporter substrate binding protein [Rhodospirillales bacterium]